MTKHTAWLYTLNRARIPFSRTCLAAAMLTLSACGGSGSDESDVPEVPGHQVVDACVAVPEVAKVAGYPLYEVPSGAVGDVCDIIRHYEAGYAIVSDVDIDPWNPADGDLLIQTASILSVNQPPEGDPQHLNGTASHPPEYVADPAKDFQRMVFARHPGGSGQPWECQVESGVAQDLTPGLQDCLTQLRDMVATDEPEVRARSAEPSVRALGSSGSNAGAAVVSMTDWTLLGTNQQRIWTTAGGNYSHYEHDHFNWMFGQSTGEVSATYDVYRMNASGSEDYYLVKIRWATTPKKRHNGCGRLDGCGFYNNSHSINFTLTRKQGDAPAQPGILVEYSPKNVVRDQLYTAKIGGDFSMGEKGPGAVAKTEISTTYKYSAASITATEKFTPTGEMQLLQFDTSHATSTAPGWGIRLFDGDATTIGTMQSTLWALYKFPVSEKDERDDTSIVLNVGALSGEFGYARGATFVFDLFSNDTKLGPYKAVPAGGKAFHTLSFSLPHFSVHLKDQESGRYARLPSGSADVLSLKRGQTYEFLVNSGGVALDGQSSSHPIALAWTFVDLPNYLMPSTQSGNRQSKVSLIVRGDAQVGAMGFLRLNTLPRGAAPGMQGGDYAIQYRVVE